MALCHSQKMENGIVAYFCVYTRLLQLHIFIYIYINTQTIYISWEHTNYEMVLGRNFLRSYSSSKMNEHYMYFVCYVSAHLYVLNLNRSTKLCSVFELYLPQALVYVW